MVELARSGLRCPECETKTVAGAVRGWRVGVRPAVAGGDRDVDGAAGDLAPRSQRAGVGCVGIGLLIGRSTRSASAQRRATPTRHTSLRDGCSPARGARRRDRRRTAAIRERAGAAQPGRVRYLRSPRTQPRAVRRVIGPFAGIVVSDRWPGMRTWTPTSGRSAGRICSATFAAKANGSPSRRPSAKQGIKLTAACVVRVARYQREHHDRARLQADLEPVQHQLRRLLEAARANASARANTTLATTAQVWPALLDLHHPPRSKPTNNLAERALRGPVIHRKLHTAPAAMKANGSPSAPSPL